jgi:hypothetical protein
LDETYSLGQAASSRKKALKTIWPDQLSGNDRLFDCTDKTGEFQA